MTRQMYQKFEKYWSDHSLILAMAVILDPRYKFQFVDYCYKKLNGYGSTESMHIRDCMFSLFNQYMLGSSKTPTASTSTHGDVETGTSSETSEAFRKADAFKDFDTFERFDFVTTAQKSQLELYLDEPRVDRMSNLDILDFWKTKQSHYPQLSLMAHDILTIPISTVASESAFSIGGRVLDKYRSALKPDIAEALICTRDWVFEKKDVEEAELDEIVEDVINSSSYNETQSTQCSANVESNS
ncbi:zinc finger BED domain-containing protein DAYSLEEPER-like [Phoenix dactylifera]|uniref:Zinc finger BED domain-containing protein DAYSLEEPER-like n=1 Tax=Phoenix dactylifera TaxID=42345 RepID=A0A8B8ZV73_PHODC|nr:zinc finger BED domain-containing protein DAYSLEEPER-like [Phoenix dactylifera]XP_038978187.1 zinc finger BED domain-containing protein DAYSLEEPER-like [Phoenix dactylifera]